MKTSIWWIRRDLRLADNQALKGALDNSKQVLPVFILDPTLLESQSKCKARIGFLFASLRILDGNLKERGNKLIVRKGNPKQVLEELVSESGAEGIFAERDVSPYARSRDETVASSIPLKLIPGLMVHPPEDIKKLDGSPYTIYTPFSRAWQRAGRPDHLIPAPDYIPTVSGIYSEDIPSEPGFPFLDIFPAGEGEGQRRLDEFSRATIDHYHEQRDRVDLDGTSGLSPYLRFGLVSIRQASLAAWEAIERTSMDCSAQGAETWLNELIWREFYNSILYHFPFVKDGPFRAKYQRITWRNNQDEFARWKEGTTGYPVVDAAMRQLLHTGWMHNRARMITASFLTKDLLIDWRWGEKWFMQNLLDGDLAANNGGWQWVAGTGTDAAPYFRIFNPTMQGKKFDPKGIYVKQWVPELVNIPEEFIHEPWKMNSQQQRESGCQIGKDYPQPIVEHDMARQRTLRAYKI